MTLHDIKAKRLIVTAGVTLIAGLVTTMPHARPTTFLPGTSIR